ncbi:hypothetical protein BVRB_7g164440 [Beta vulgaris subsp. vulgaris]|nr:hypothetical protein BVRB_7g164440 [Beta vulgaris subsp. vulgaris]
MKNSSIDLSKVWTLRFTSSTCMAVSVPSLTKLSTQLTLSFGQKSCNYFTKYPS